MKVVLLLLLTLPVFAEVAYPYRPRPPSATWEAAERHERFGYRSDSHEERGYDEMSDLYEGRSRHAAIQLREAEAGEERGFASRLQEQRDIREQRRAFQRRRMREPDTYTARERQMNRMTERSWHKLPHQGASSAKKRQYLWPYKQGSFPPNEYSNGR